MKDYRSLQTQCKPGMNEMKIYGTAFQPGKIDLLLIGTIQPYSPNSFRFYNAQGATVGFKQKRITRSINPTILNLTYTNIKTFTQNPTTLPQSQSGWGKQAAKIQKPNTKYKEKFITEFEKDHLRCDTGC